MDLYNELQQKIKELNISIKKLRETGTEYAEAESWHQLWFVVKLYWGVANNEWMEMYIWFWKIIQN